MSELNRIAREDCDLEMTPMIDVTFLLLIFFICTIKFKSLEGKLSAFLPNDVGVAPDNAPPKETTEVLIKVLVEGTKLDPISASELKSRDPQRVAHWNGEPGSRFVFGEDRVVAYTLGPRTTSDIDVLASRLDEIFERESRPGEDAPSLSIDPRKGTVYEDVVAVLDRAIGAEFTDITFVGSYED